MPDLETPGHLSITPAVKEAFRSLLDDYSIALEFTYGHWGGLAEELKAGGEGYDLILTAETIYAEESVDDLVSVLRYGSTTFNAKKGSSTSPGKVGLEDTFGIMSVKENWAHDITQGEKVVLVAAKVSLFTFCIDTHSCPCESYAKKLT